jgi:hypothetical protein
MNIRQVGFELFHEKRQTDGQTDMKKLKVCLANLRMRLKKSKSLSSTE